MGNLFQELRRRNVFRVAVAYGVVAWLLIQVMDTITPRLGLPDWIPTLVIVLALLGFPVAVLLAWAFEITPEGLKKTEDVREGETITQTTGQKLNVIIIGTLVLALGYSIWGNRFSGNVPTMDVTAIITDKSIAVLPFADFSPGGDQAWFADGLSEEILNSLVRTADLKVSSRTSSFAYRDTTLEIPEIARILGVAHILEGSVRRTDTRLRITAQLIRASDGFHLWSENYDRTPDDAIAIQEDLAISISQALQTAMDPVALVAMASVGTESIAAYNAYLEGLALNPCIVDLGCVAAQERAIGFDPEFAEAHFQLANYWNQQLDITTIAADADISFEEIKERFQRHISRAIEFAGNPVDLLKYRAIRARVDLRLVEHRDLLKAYLQSRPNDVYSWNLLTLAEQGLGDLPAALAAIHTSLQLNNDMESAFLRIADLYSSRDFASAAQLAQRVMIEEPTHRNALYQAHRALLWAGAVPEAADAARLFLQTSSPAADSTFADKARDDLVKIRQACAEGRVADANQVFENFAALDDPPLHWLALTNLGRNQQAEDLLRIFDSPEHALELHSFFGYPQFDPRPFPSLMAVLEREGATLLPVIPVPFACTQN